MRYLIILLFFFTSLHSEGQVSSRDNVTFPKTYKKVKVDPSACSSAPLQLVFEDNFDDTVPDVRAWRFTPPWGAVFFFGDSSRLDSGQNGGAECASAKGLMIRDGILHLQVKKEPLKSRASYDKSDSALQPDGSRNGRYFEFYSGALFSDQAFGPGKFEIRCKLPEIDGVWPAFWLYGSCGQEFDVFEFLNERYSESTNECSRKLHMTYHKEAECGNGKTWCSNGTTRLDTVDYSKDFHTFAVEWDPYQISWMVDGKVTKTIYGLKKLYTNRSVSSCKAKKNRTYRLYDVMPEDSRKVNVIVSCAVVNYGNGKHPITRGNYPKEMLVDYVKVWQR